MAHAADKNADPTYVFMSLSVMYLMRYAAPRTQHTPLWSLQGGQGATRALRVVPRASSASKAQPPATTSTPPVPSAKAHQHTGREGHQPRLHQLTKPCTMDG